MTYLQDLYWWASLLYWLWNQGRGWHFLPSERASVGSYCTCRERHPLFNSGLCLLRCWEEQAYPLSPEDMEKRRFSINGTGKWPDITRSCISFTPSDKSLTSDDIGEYPLASSFVFNLYAYEFELTRKLNIGHPTHHLQKVRSCTSLDLVSRLSSIISRAEGLSNRVTIVDGIK